MERGFSPIWRNFTDFTNPLVGLQIPFNGSPINAAQIRFASRHTGTDLQISTNPKTSCICQSRRRVPFRGLPHISTAGLPPCGVLQFQAPARDNIHLHRVLQGSRFSFETATRVKIVKTKVRQWCNLMRKISQSSSTKFINRKKPWTQSASYQ